MTKILLVEDDVNLREIFQMRLIAEGYDTVTADNGEDGLVVAMKEKPDLIISDVMMPKLSGFEMLETLRAAPEMANTKAIMMTALGQAEDRARGEKLGVIKYLVKSQVTLEDFVRVVREVIQPGQASDTTAAAPATSDQVTQSNKESEGSMPPTDQPTNVTPTPDGSDSNPISGGVPADTPQQSTDQEQSAVQDQINSFVNSDDTAASEPAAPAPDSAPAPTDAGVSTGGDSGSAFGGEPPASPAPDAGASSDDAPAADTTAPEPPASTEPPQAAPEPPASTSNTL